MNNNLGIHMRASTVGQLVLAREMKKAFCGLFSQRTTILDKGHAPHKSGFGPQNFRKSGTQQAEAR